MTPELIKSAIDQNIEAVWQAVINEVSFTELAFRNGEIFMFVKIGRFEQLIRRF